MWESNTGLWNVFTRTYGYEVYAITVRAENDIRSNNIWETYVRGDNLPIYPVSIQS